MYDKGLIGSRFARRLKQYHALASVQRDIAVRLFDSIESCGIHAPRVLEIGSGTGFLTAMLHGAYGLQSYQAIDLASNSGEYLPAGVEFTRGDGEFFTPTQKVDMIASASTVQWFDDLGGFIDRSYNNLSETGVLALSTFGQENFLEIRQTTGSGLQYYSLEQLSHMAQSAGFRIIELCEWTQQMHFNSVMDVLGHIRSTGVNSGGTSRLSRSDLRELDKKYFGIFAGYPLTFHPQILVCQRS